MTSAAIKKTGPAGALPQRSAATGRFGDGGPSGGALAEPASPGLAALLQQVDRAVRAAYGTGRPTQLTVRLLSPSSAADIEVEPLPADALPVDIEAEQALLGALLYDNDGFEHLGPALTARDFYEPFHRRLFAVMEDAWRRRELAEPILMAEQFAKDPAFQELGGVRYLADLVDRAPSTKDVPAFAARIGGLALRRRPPADDELEAALRDARARGEARAAEVLAGPDMLGADDFAKLIGATRETVRQKLKRGEILGLQGAKRGVRYPAWQVTRNGGLLPGLPTLFELLDSPWAVFRFLIQPSPALGGEAPKDGLRGGKVAEVLELAEGHARGDFG